MLYRKSSPHPPTFLLRIVATAGAGALLGATACGGSSTMGSIAIADSGSGNDAGNGGVPPRPCGGGICGSAVMPPDSGEVGFIDSDTAYPDSWVDSPGPCNGGPCGSVVMPVDAGEASVMGIMVGLVPNQDAEADAHGPCGGGPCGIVIHPEGGSDQ
jgi:hypothetical protein